MTVRPPLSKSWNQVLHHLTCSSDPGLAKNDKGGGSVAVTGQMDHHAAVIVRLAGLRLSFPPSDRLAEVEGGIMSRVV